LVTLHVLTEKIIGGGVPTSFTRSNMKSTHFKTTISRKNKCDRGRKLFDSHL